MCHASPANASQRDRFYPREPPIIEPGKEHSCIHSTSPHQTPEAPSHACGSVSQASRRFVLRAEFGKSSGGSLRGTILANRILRGAPFRDFAAIRWTVTSRGAFPPGAGSGSGDLRFPRSVIEPSVGDETSMSNPLHRLNASERAQFLTFKRPPFSWLSLLTLGISVRHSGLMYARTLSRKLIPFGKD